MGHERIQPGTYRALQEVSVSLVRGPFRGDQTELKRVTHKLGEVFTVPTAADDGYWYRLSWHDDRDDEAPLVEAIDA